MAASEAGAAIIDVKEPLNGSLGRAGYDVWSEVRNATRPDILLSLALGELADWTDSDIESVPTDACSGFAFRKIGLAQAPRNWAKRLEQFRHAFDARQSGTSGWVAVVYLDWRIANSPPPDFIVGEALGTENCHGVLFDTWQKKSERSVMDSAWKPLLGRVQDSGRFIALAGSLDAEAIARLRSLEPDIFAVRGAACLHGDRLNAIDPERVSRLARAIRSDPECSRSAGSGQGAASTSN